MTAWKQTLTLVILSALFAVCQAQDSLPPELSERFTSPGEGLVTGGQPSQTDLEQLKNTGVTKVINLRGPDEEAPYHEKAAAEELGLAYVSLPISGAADVSSKNAEKLHQVLNDNETVFLHCATGNRVGALLAIRAYEIEGKPADEALAFGRAAGLGSLEEKVKSILSEEHAASNL